MQCGKELLPREGAWRICRSGLRKAASVLSYSHLALLRHFFPSARGSGIPRLRRPYSSMTDGAVSTQLEDLRTGRV